MPARLTLRDCKSRAPLVSQNVQTNAAVRVDVGVVDTSGEVDLWGLEGVVGREMNVQEENATGVWRVTLHTISHVPPRNQTCEDLQDP